MPPGYEVYIPALNAAGTVAATVRSLVAQDLPPDRIVVVDDGSTDDTGAVAAAVGAEVVRQANAGSAAARQRGLDMCKSAFVAFVDADDEWFPHLASTLLPLLHERPRAAALGGRAEPFADTAAPLGVWRGGQATGEVRAISPAEVWKQNPMTSSVTVLRTAMVRAVGGYGDLPMFEDYGMWLRLAGAGYELYALDMIAGRYRVRGDGQTADVVRSLRAEVAILRSFAASPLGFSFLDDAAVERRVAMSWWRGVARAVHYGLTPRDIPPLAEFAEAGKPARAVAAAVQLPRLAPLLCAAWRAYSEVARPAFRRALRRTQSQNPAATALDP